MPAPGWRRAHGAASGLLAIVAGLHSGLTAFLYDDWSADAVWFLGTGLSLLLLAVINLSHLSAASGRQPTVRVVKTANWVFLAFGVGAVIAVPEPQAFVVLAALAGQAVAAHQTLQGQV